MMERLPVPDSLFTQSRSSGDPPYSYSRSSFLRYLVKWLRDWLTGRFPWCIGLKETNVARYERRKFLNHLPTVATTFSFSPSKQEGESIDSKVDLDTLLATKRILSLTWNQPPWKDIDPAGMTYDLVSSECSCLLFIYYWLARLVSFLSYDLSKGGGLASRMQGSDPHAYPITRFIWLRHLRR